MPVNNERDDYKEMKMKWDRLRDCFEGRDAVLKAGNKYVPDLPGADTTTNIAYRKRGNFYNALQRTVAGLAGAIFQKSPEVDVTESVKPMLDDVTMTGVNFEMFAGDAGRDVMLTGRYGVLVDMPVAGSAADARPYLLGYAAEDIVNWRTERRGGDEQIMLIVLHERVEAADSDDPFCTDMLVQYRVLELKDNKCTVQLWREDSGNKGTFVTYEDEKTLVRRGIPLNFIPFVFLGAQHATPDLERPPLIDLADVNLAHWRNSCDHEYGLHLVALPTPWIAGSKGSRDGPMKIGPSVVWELEATGHAGMLEFTGSGLKAITEAMDVKVKQMSSLGARLFEEGVSRDTATAVLVRHSGEHATLRTVAGSIESGFTMILQIVGWWIGTETVPVDVDANVELNKEYLDIKATAQEIQVALTALQAGEISFDTWWDIITAGGWGREGIDADAELKAIKERKALAPEPALDPSLSSPDPVATPVAPKRKTISGPDGAVKYVVTEG